MNKKIFIFSLFLIHYSWATPENYYRIILHAINTTTDRSDTFDLIFGPYINAENAKEEAIVTIKRLGYTLWDFIVVEENRQYVYRMEYGNDKLHLQ